ncbi:hypothetical protein [Pseudomonas sp. McL0111]|uniref:hypothetical protein n=1 Tax=Pseudomonas sp. McL0111 TaxID=3457357 RepID=UPI00403ECF44
MKQNFWKALGIIRSTANLQWASPSPFLPRFNFYEIHESGAIRARPEDIIAAVYALDIRDDRVVNALLSIRELPSKILSKFGTRSQQQQTRPFGFDSFTLLQRTPHELSMGLAGRFWRPDLSTLHIPGAEEFGVLDLSRIAKLVLRFQVIEQARGVYTLRTETFVYCANTRTKLLFTPYWLVIRFASGWIRRRNLASIQRQFSTVAR